MKVFRSEQPRCSIFHVLGDTSCALQPNAASSPPTTLAYHLQSTGRMVEGVYESGGSTSHAGCGSDDFGLVPQPTVEVKFRWVRKFLCDLVCVPEC